MVPICVTCNKEMRCDAIGYLVRISDEEVRSADLYECDGCGAWIACNGGDPFQTSQSLVTVTDLTRKEA